MYDALDCSVHIRRANRFIIDGVMMGKRLKYTPNSKLRSALRVVWMRSRERAEALKNTGYCCAVCGVKQSVAKGAEVRLDVHHVNHTVNWDRIFRVIREELLTPPETLAPLCKECHKKQHETERRTN